LHFGDVFAALYTHGKLANNAGRYQHPIDAEDIFDEVASHFGYRWIRKLRQRRLFEGVLDYI
jgi:hypothetical protein